MNRGIPTVFVFANVVFGVRFSDRCRRFAGKCGVPAPQPKEDVFAEVMDAGKVYSHSELVDLLVDRADIKAGSAKVKISRAVKAGIIVKNQAGSYYLPSSRIEVEQPELDNKSF